MGVVVVLSSVVGNDRDGASPTKPSWSSAKTGTSSATNKTNTTAHNLLWHWVVSNGCDTSLRCDIMIGLVSVTL